MGTRILELDTIQYPGSDSTPEIQVGSGTVTIQSGVSVDINGGTIDGTTIGASSAAAGSFSTISGTLADGVTATTQAHTDDSTKVATTAYVKSVVTQEDLDVAGDTGTGAIDLNSQSLTVAGTTNEIETSASGQTITIGLPDTITADLKGDVKSPNGTVVLNNGTGAGADSTFIGTATNATTLATGRTISTTGDVTYTSGSFDGSANVTGAATIANNAVTTAKLPNATSATDGVTYAKIQNVSATNRILGRDSANAGPIEEISPADLRTMINVADGATNTATPYYTSAIANATTSAAGLMSSADKTAVDGQGMRFLFTSSGNNSSSNLDLDLSSYSYDHYKIIIKHLVPATDNASFSIILGTSSSSFATSGYFGVGKHLYYTTNGYNGDGRYQITDCIASYSTVGSDSAGGVHAELNLYDLHSTSYYSAADFTAMEYDVTDGDMNRKVQSCKRTSATNDAYVRISCNSGNIKQGKFSVYAILN